MAQRAPSRKQARRDAVFLLYQREVTSLSMEQLVVGHKLREGYAPDEYTIAVVRGVAEHTAELDAELGAHTRDWAVSRIAPLERSILRLALWELRHTDTPPQVVVDEAVRLTKRYSTDDSSRFVNGVLGGVLGAVAAGGDGDRDADEDHDAGGEREGGGAHDAGGDEDAVAQDDADGDQDAGDTGLPEEASDA